MDPLVVRTRGLDERYEFLRPVETYRVETLNPLALDERRAFTPPLQRR
jgi:hypothetical protein